jgi:hypothetical protein
VINEKLMKNAAAIMWLIKRGTDKCLDNQVVLRRGG